jgi:O-antigen ligase
MAAAGAVAIAAVAAGFLVLLPTRGVLVVIVALAAALFVGFARTAASRSYLSSLRTLRDGSDTPVEAVTGVDEFRLPRIVYYVGLVFMSLLTIRAGRPALSDVLFLLSFALACAVLFMRHRQVPIRLPALFVVGVGAFAVGGFLSSFQSYDSLRSVSVVVKVIFLTVFWFWLGTVVLTKRQHVTTAITAWITGAAICGAAALVQVAVGQVIPTTIWEGARATGFTWHPNDLGGLTSVAFVPAIMLASRARTSVPMRAFSYALLFLVAVGLILSGSVGSFLAAGAATFIWFALQRTSFHSLLAFGALALVVLSVTALQVMRSAPTPLERLTQVTSSKSEGGTGSVSARIATYRVVASSIERRPFVGVGLDLKSATKPFPIFSYEYDVHNLVISTWYKAGLLGLAGMLTAIFAMLKVGWTVVRRSTSLDERSIAVSLLAGFVAFVVLGMGSPILFVRYGWVAAAMILALQVVQQREAGLVRESSRRGVLATAPARL